MSLEITILRASTERTAAMRGVYTDSAGSLFGSTRGGNPGTWRRVQTVAV